MTIVAALPTRRTNALSRRAFFTTALLVGAFAGKRSARAHPRRGAIRVVRRKVKEHDQAWRVLMRVRLPSPPAQPTVSLRFQLAQVEDFQPGDDDQPKRVPVDPPRIVVRQREVDVRDIAGKIGVRARAELSLARAEGFRAGVWILSVRGPDGPIGQDVRLVLHGINDAERPSDRAAPDAGADGSA